MTVAHRAALMCFAAAAAWPTAMGWLANAMASPLERALRNAWCGVPFHSASEILGHCAACWSGSAILVATGLCLLAPARRRAPARK